ncbi:hypothetical protein INO08_16645, partial [Staphylococcus aureus]|nr:hypothetical protein [Staphylococcus aureus]
SHSPPKGIRFSLKKEFFEGAVNYDELPDRVIGEIHSWIDRGQYRIKILWPVDESNTVQFLGQLLDPQYDIRLETFEDG